MTSNKKESEAFNLLQFMYNDDDDDMEDADRDEDEAIEEPKQIEEQKQTNLDETAMASEEEPDMRGGDSVVYDMIDGSSSNVISASIDSEMLRRERLTIVDYGHDEVAMSPEAEEGEISGTGRVMFGEELQTANAEIQERSPSEHVQISTPIVQLTPQSSAQADITQSDANNTLKESETEISEGINMSGKTDPLIKFLPPPPKAKCSKELQDRINKFLSYKKLGRSFNAEVRNRKDYRNPDFLLHAVRYQDIDQIGSCFNKDVFDPHGYDGSDYYDAIEADMKREIERKEQERKKSQKVEFVSGGTQAAVHAAQKINMAVSGADNLSSSGSQSAATAVDGTNREGRQNKKSKWDKVDGDRRSTLGGGQDTLSAIGPQTALSAANVGGYSVFAQQKRREAEEKRSSERKVDRRS